MSDRVVKVTEFENAVLKAAGNNENVTMRQLSEALGCSVHAVCGAVSTLGAKDLIYTKKVKPEKGKSYLAVFLRKAGKELV